MGDREGEVGGRTQTTWKEGQVLVLLLRRARRDGRSPRFETFRRSPGTGSVRMASSRPRLRMEPPPPPLAGVAVSATQKQHAATDKAGLVLAPHHSMLPSHWWVPYPGEDISGKGWPSAPRPSRGVRAKHKATRRPRKPRMDGTDHEKRAAGGRHRRVAGHPAMDDRGDDGLWNEQHRPTGDGPRRRPEGVGCGRLTPRRGV